MQNRLDRRYADLAVLWGGALVAGGYCWHLLRGGGIASSFFLFVVLLSGSVASSIWPGAPAFARAIEIGFVTCLYLLGASSVYLVRPFSPRGANRTVAYGLAWLFAFLLLLSLPPADSFP
jgi:hypothetical protein